MKKIIALLTTLLLIAALTACGAVSAEVADLTVKYLPETAGFVRSEKDDGFTEHIYRDAVGGEYVLLEDRDGTARALEYDSKVRSSASEVVLTAEEAFAVITAEYPNAVLVAAVEDRDDRAYEWSVLFTDENLLAFYELDAATGAVLEYDLFFTNVEQLDPAAIITANLPGAELRELSLDADDGRLYLEGEALMDRRIVEFTIDAETGTVVEIEYEDDDD